MERFLWGIYIFIILGSIRESCTAKSEVKCRDESGKNVDWFIVYKLPKLAGSNKENFKEGAGYYFLTPGATQFQMSQRWINESNSMLMTTVTEGLKDSQVARVIWNDQPFDLPPVIRNGHTKGMILAGDLGGIWLSHSTPHFPKLGRVDESTINVTYPEGGLINGQLFFCQSLKLNQLDSLAEILAYTRPFIFNSSIPAKLQQSLPNLLKFTIEYPIRISPPWFKQFSLQFNQLNLEIFAKAPKFRREIFADWISPNYNQSLDVQSWQNGAHPYYSNCTVSKNTVLNIKMKGIGGMNFTETVDHSKWAVGTQDKPLFCIADLNRMKPQKTRSGMAICVLEQNIWNSFRGLVKEIEKCNPLSNPNFRFKIKKKKKNHLPYY